MEKEIVIVGRYHIDNFSFVEVSRENSHVAKRDYWLCSRLNSTKRYMFSHRYVSDAQEEKLICKFLRKHMSDENGINRAV